jgi:hypothetical protein
MGPKPTLCGRKRNGGLDRDPLDFVESLLSRSGAVPRKSHSTTATALHKLTILRGEEGLPAATLEPTRVSGVDLSMEGAAEAGEHQPSWRPKPATVDHLMQGG